MNMYSKFNSYVWLTKDAEKKSQYITGAYGKSKLLDILHK